MRTSTTLHEFRELQVLDMATRATNRLDVVIVAWGMRFETTTGTVRRQSALGGWTLRELRGDSCLRMPPRYAGRQDIAS